MPTHALGMAAGGSGTENGAWMKTIGRNQPENAIRILPAEHPSENTTGALFLASHSSWSVSVDFLENPGAATTASISFASNGNGVIAAPGASFRTNGMPELEGSNYRFDWMNVSDAQAERIVRGSRATVR